MSEGVKSIIAAGGWVDGGWMVNGETARGERRSGKKKRRREGKVTRGMARDGGGIWVKEGFLALKICSMR
eukprot:CAMPEP_0118648332 /NCGR_PEP_ID=MMETSP0785-20121206/9097_1 /TAXON_ID=91992 /ORGANISM="Bolidomonas pacifica, Strain CCMP 1866" /LENGTH=69 /DNA_ID=CAMNT_0006540513 /DNA_START=605 /DNA_END=814 /DNA_ORIENTATION=+